jgi:hypothetical protein
MTTLADVLRSLAEVRRPEKAARLLDRLAKFDPSARFSVIVVDANAPPKPALTVATVVKTFGKDGAMDFADRIARHVERARNGRRDKPTRVMVTDIPSPYHEGGGTKFSCTSATQRFARTAAAPFCRLGPTQRRAARNAERHCTVVTARLDLLSRRPDPHPANFIAQLVSPFTVGIAVLSTHGAR